MGVLFPNGNITVYQYDKEALKYNRLNIPNVNINNKRNASVSGNGINVIYTTTIVIPNYYQVNTRDIVINGNLTLDITKADELKGYEVLTVVGKQYNNIFKTITLECK